jgi:hypothetical protein
VQLPSEEIIQRTKIFFRDHYGEELTTEKAIECVNNLTNYFEILIDWDRNKGIEREEGSSNLGTTCHRAD